MKSIFEYLLWFKGYQLKRASNTYKDIQAMGPELFSNWHKERKWEIVHWHLKNNPFYRQYVEESPKDWEQLPVLQKKHFQRPLAEMLAKPLKEKGIYIGNTSGSSGHPFFYAKDKYAHAMSWAQIKALYASHGLTLANRQARFYGIPLSGRSRWIELAKDRIMNRRRFPVFDLSDEVLEKWARIFKREAFDYIYGYSHSLTYFARYCRDSGQVLKNLCPTLKCCIVTSEVCTPEDRSVLEEGFGLRVVNEYGASECGLLAFESPDGKWKLCEEFLYIEVVDEQNKAVPDGQPGRILVTSLFNRAMPFIRYEIGDIGSVKTLPDGKRVLLRLEGRTNDFLRLPNGKLIPGLTFYYVSRSLLENTGYVKEFIVVQTDSSKVKFVMNNSRPITPTERQLIRQHAAQYLSPEVEVEIEEVKQIERPASGKIKHFYSNI